MPLLANRLLIPLPPIWLLGVAAAATLACALAGYGLLRLVLPRSAAEARALVAGRLGPVRLIDNRALASRRAGG